MFFTRSTLFNKKQKVNDHINNKIYKRERGASFCRALGGAGVTVYQTPGKRDNFRYFAYNDPRVGVV